MRYGYYLASTGALVGDPDYAAESQVMGKILQEEAGGVMRIDMVGHWLGGELPEHLKGDGPFEVSGEEILRLAETYDVAIMHHKQAQPSKREQRQGAKPVPDKLGLWLDHKGGRFHQR